MAPHASDLYFGTYARFDTADKRAGAALAGPDNAVGDVSDIVFVADEEGRQIAWLQNSFGQRVGFFDRKLSHTLAIYQAKGWVLRAVLSFCAYSEEPAPGLYWGQAAVMAYDARHAEAFDAFVRVFARKAADGSRPDPSLGAAGVATVLANPEQWQPSNKVKIPHGNGRTAILKDHRTGHDKMLDAARRKNPGCYLIGWLFILALAAGAAWLAHSMGVF